MSAPIYFGDIDANLISPGPWPKPNAKGPEVKNHPVDLVYNSYQVGIKISTPLLAVAGEPEKNTNIKAWELKIALDNFHKPEEKYQVEFHKKIQEIEQLGLEFAPGFFSNLGASKDTPIELGSTIYIGESVKYPPSFRLKLDHAQDEEKQVIAQQFRSTVKNPLFVALDTDKMIDVTPANIKEHVKPGCKCKMAIEIKGWTYRLRKEDKTKGLGEAVVVRVRVAPIVIGISAPPAPEKPWDFNFTKLENNSKSHQLSEKQIQMAEAQNEVEKESRPKEQEVLSDSYEEESEDSDTKQSNPLKRSHDEDGTHF